MKRAAFTIFLMASACSPEVKLELDVDDPESPRPDDSPESPSPESPSLGDLAWAFIEPGLKLSSVTHLEWTDDGGVIAAGSAVLDGSGAGNVFLAQVAATGTLARLIVIRPDDLLALTGGFGDDAVVRNASAEIAAIDRFEDGRILVALNLDVTVLIDGLPGHAFRGFLRWYDSDGNLLKTRMFLKASDRVDLPEIFDESYPGALLGSILALPDGGALLTGQISAGGPDPFGAIIRFDADGRPVWTTITDTEPIVMGLTATPDGGILLHGVFFESVTVGDKTTEGPNEGAFLARLEADDGSCTWLQSFDGANHLLFSGGVGVAPGGNLIAVGAFKRGSVQAGEFDLSAPENSDNYFLSELAPDGEVLSLSEIEHLSPVVSGEKHWLLESASVANGTVVMGGLDTEWNEELTVGFGVAFIAIFDFRGQLIAERRMFASQDELNHGAVQAVAIAPDGGVLAGGFWEHEIDLGDGNVLETTEPHVGQLFVALYHPVEEATSVDLIAP
jgi:hypothetical protein